jgi:RNA polymerase sigma-70 factor (ECF subfamily)
MRVDTDETEIVTRAAHGDSDAFRQLWETHHAIAMAAALRLCHQRVLAEEITQGAFLRAWQGLPSFRQGSPFRPWLLRILYRHALNVMEKQRHHLHPVTLEDVLEIEISQGRVSGTMGDMQERVAQQEELRQALACLSKEQRQVIALRYGADLTEHDIAQVLQWPLGTVKSRLNRARERLRILLTENEKGVEA